MTDHLNKTLEFPVSALTTTDARARTPLSEPSTGASEAIRIAGGLYTTERVAVALAASTADRATLTVIAALNAGQTFALEREETVLGRDPNADITLDDTSISRRHAVIRRTAEGGFVVCDANSTNGTFVGEQRIEEPTLLVSGDRLQLGPNVLLRFALTDEAEASLQHQLYESSTRDPLTETFNRKYLAQRLASEIAYARRHGSALALLILDIDHFKRVNDTHGHLAGDRVLRGLAARIARTIRLEDVLARYGGEEFAVLARASGAVDAHRLAERLRAAVEELRILEGDAIIRVTTSIGVALHAESPDDADGSALLARADQRLYRAKSNGRNRVCDGG